MCSGCHSLTGAKLNDPDLTPSTGWPQDQLEPAIKRMEKNVGPLTDEQVSAFAEFMKAPDIRERLILVRFKMRLSPILQSSASITSSYEQIDPALVPTPIQFLLAEGNLESRHGRATYAKNLRGLFQLCSEQSRQQHRLTLSQGLDGGGGGPGQLRPLHDVWINQRGLAMAQPYHV